MGAFASSSFNHRCKKSLSDLEYPSPNMYLEEYEDQNRGLITYIFGKEVLRTGPLVNEEVVPFCTNDDHISHGNLSDEAILEWLSKKDKSSTVFVSFGSEFYMSREEIEETAIGLELR
ncbi:hypothetical protein Sjap_018980 [Stephania japonica]|uniref:Uncharacterized protein n=1 Tax=Stephania japonica TaxID=461633 RepID=A0AAP0EZ55_9MAGN